VTRQQLLALGLGPAAIAYRAKHGKMFREHDGVYSLGRPARTPHEHASAAVLACGPGAALSHTSALALWGIAGKLEAPFHVAVPRNRRPAGIRTHQLRGLQRRDVTNWLGIRTTTLARTLLDCAPKLPERRRTRAVNDALRSPYLSREQLADVVERNPHHHGARLLRPFVTRHDGPTRSELEDAFLALCHDYQLPEPLLNTKVNGYEVDAFFPDHNLIVELDGWGFHNTRQAFEDDRTRDVDALAHGLATVRITHKRMTEEPATEAARLRQILSRGSAPPAPSGPESPSPRGSRASRAAPRTRRPKTDRPAR
jgi:very-short-patch-repair endonuclease